ncbi:MAG: hypothetical protein L6R40_003467 [Gallowayella cf. fulva]|nr:MAG: hypothetical protein L6R40_003467 [Xanthomendoza cf. fulva]
MADKVTPASSLGKTREPAFEPTVGFNNSPQTDTIVDLISSFHMNEPPTLHSSIISPLRSIYCTQMVTIEVGPQKVPFLVHKGLICGHSKYFSAAFNGFFKEAATQSIHLTEEDPVAFEILHIWLYTERLTEIKDGQDVALSPHRCLDVYMLGDKFDMPHLCDAAINRISEHAVETQELSTRFIISSYERTCSDSQLCDFIVAVLEQNLRSGHRDTGPDRSAFAFSTDTSGVNPVHAQATSKAMLWSICS